MSRSATAWLHSFLKDWTDQNGLEVPVWESVARGPTAFGGLLPCEAIPAGQECQELTEKSSQRFDVPETLALLARCRHFVLFGIDTRRERAHVTLSTLKSRVLNRFLKKSCPKAPAQAGRLALE